MPRNWTYLRCFVPLFIVIAAVLGCSDSYDPVAPDLTQDDAWQGGGGIGDRSSFQQVLKDSQHENYTEVSGEIDGGAGGSFSGSVSGYQNSFSLSVPAGAFQGFSTLKILVPNEAVPVYQLLPHSNFDEDVTVTLDYYMWIVEGDIAHGDSCEVFFMNEVTEEFEQLPTRATFVADSTAASVSFETDHFSRWHIKKDDLG